MLQRSQRITGGFLKETILPTLPLGIHLLFGRNAWNGEIPLILVGEAVKEKYINKWHQPIDCVFKFICDKGIFLNESQYQWIVLIVETYYFSPFRRSHEQGVAKTFQRLGSFRVCAEEVF